MYQQYINTDQLHGYIEFRRGQYPDQHDAKGDYFSCKDAAFRHERMDYQAMQPYRKRTDDSGVFHTKLQRVCNAARPIINR